MTVKMTEPKELPHLVLAVEDKMVFVGAKCNPDFMICQLGIEYIQILIWNRGYLCYKLILVGRIWR